MKHAYDDEVIYSSEDLFGPMNQYPEELQATLLSLTNAGEAKRNFNWVHQFNKGHYAKAADTLLIHREYMDSTSLGDKTETTKRLNKANKIMIKYDGGFGD
jgi:hypothetical protein